MIQKKICMLGAFAVGKTSLVGRFVRQMFSDKYLTTVGVRIDKKELRVGDADIKLLLWDLHGEDEFQRLQMSYLRGASGCVFVADGTNRVSLREAAALRGRALEHLGALPCVLALNKIDLHAQWEVGAEDLRQWEGASIHRTSAKTGEGVEAMFHALAAAMMGGA